MTTASALDYIAKRREVFTPGHVILSHYWRSHDLVLEYVETERFWEVLVVTVVKDGDGWKVPRGALRRCHATEPDDRDRVVATGIALSKDDRRRFFIPD
jgi:hypothetical protein